MKNKSVRVRLVIMSFLQFAVWGAYLTSMGNYLGKAGLSDHIGWFYSMQGLVSIFMPALVGIVADKFMPAQKVLSICHGVAGLAMLAAGYYCMGAGDGIDFAVLFPLYGLSVAFYMPTIALSNSVAYNILESNGYDTVRDFPPIRVFGTVGFICSMLFVNFMRDSQGVQFQSTYWQFMTSGVLGLVLMVYALTLQNCPVKSSSDHKSLTEALGLKAFTLFRDRQMAVFFIFSMLLGVALQITNGYANPFITSFKAVPEYAGTFGAENANALISISQVSETLGILLIPVCLRKLGIKKVMLIAMLAWFFRFGLFGVGNPGPGVWMFILSMLVYGVAFDFFNISGSLYVNEKTSEDIRSSAQGLFMLMTNGVGASIGMIGAQAVVNRFTHPAVVDGVFYTVGDWSTAWYIFAGYSLLVAVLFAIFFKDPAKAAK